VLAGGVSIPVIWSRDLPSAPSSVRVCRDSLGHWYASFVVTREVQPAPETTGGIGIDWGVTTTATTTSPEHDLPHHQYRKRCSAELARARKKMSRRRGPRNRAPSKGYQRAKHQAAKLHKKASRQNTHTAQLWAKQVVDQHQLIAVEDFKPRFLARSTMARKAADAAIGTTKRILIERARRAGRRVVLVPPAHTTMTCSKCGTRAKDRLDLGQRVFQCAACGYTAGRDRNAARVILAVAERGHAGVEDVRHPIPTPRGGRPGAIRARNPLDSSMGKR
jgi:putative transposase